MYTRDIYRLIHIYSLWFIDDFVAAILGIKTPVSRNGQMGVAVDVSHVGDFMCPVFL